MFVSNNRGTKNSMRHASVDPVGDAKTFFDFSFAEIGLYDIPANLNFVREKSGALPVTYIGFGDGATALLYGASRTEMGVYIRQMVKDAILLAPCVSLEKPTPMLLQAESASTILPQADIGEQLYKSYDYVFDLYDQVGVYAYNSYYSSEADTNKLCYVFGERHPECLWAKRPSGFK